jgi:hypothetical protein
MYDVRAGFKILVPEAGCAGSTERRSMATKPVFDEYCTIEWSSNSNVKDSYRAVCNARERQWIVKVEIYLSVASTVCAVYRCIALKLVSVTQEHLHYHWWGGESYMNDLKVTRANAIFEFVLLDVKLDEIGGFDVQPDHAASRLAQRHLHLIH